MAEGTRLLWATKGLGRGGVERLLVAMASHLDRDRFEVEVAYVLPHKDQLAGALTDQGIPVHCLGTARTAPTWAVALRRLVRSRGYDLVHTHSPLVGAAARALAPRGTSLVHTEHNVWERYRAPTHVANAATYHRNDAVIAVSEGVARSIRRPWWLPRRSPPPVTVVIHGIEVARAPYGAAARAEARRRLGLPAAAPVVGTVGNLTPKKDQATLLRAFRRVVDRLPAARLVVIGSGPLETALHELADELGVAGAVRFAGMREDVEHLLPGFDVFALPSLHEGLSIALVEALGAGLPSVVTGVGGIPEVVTDGGEGLFVPTGDPVAFAGALLEILEDPALRARLGQAARRRVERFSIEAAVRNTEALYEGVLAGHGGHRG